MCFSGFPPQNLRLRRACNGQKTVCFCFLFGGGRDPRPRGRGPTTREIKNARPGDVTAAGGLVRLTMTANSASGCLCHSGHPGRQRRRRRIPLSEETRRARKQNPETRVTGRAEYKQTRSRDLLTTYCTELYCKSVLSVSTVSYLSYSYGPTWKSYTHAGGDCHASRRFTRSRLVVLARLGERARATTLT